VVINPATPPNVLEEILLEVDQVLVMTVNPGFGHQQFLESTLPKIRRVCRMINDLKPGCEVEVDGGVDVRTAPLAAARPEPTSSSPARPFLGAARRLPLRWRTFTIRCRGCAGMIGPAGQNQGILPEKNCEEIGTH